MMESKKLTIFEGPDGSGKTTAALKYARETDARYVHFPALTRVKHGLARLYVEAMLPALLGYQDVVLDRCWLSETPYGEAFREGRDRLTSSDRRMLERIAYRCGAVVVLCLPAWETVKRNYLSRQGSEMLRSTDQLFNVYHLYRQTVTHLPMMTFDFEKMSSDIQSTVSLMRTPCHSLNHGTVGNWDAPVILVGEKLAERKDQDPWFQAPFVSFSGEGCSRWLTTELADHGISEKSLLWVNSDDDLEFIDELDWEPKVIALGVKAQTELYKLKVEAAAVEHPQSWKRFHAREEYPLINLIREATSS